MRLIDVNALKMNCEIKLTNRDAEILQNALQEMLDNAPTVDAVLVVRCRECKHYLHPYTLDSGETFGLCAIHDTADLPEDDFCSYGERRSV